MSLQGEQFLATPCSPPTPRSKHWRITIQEQLHSQYLWHLSCTTPKYFSNPPYDFLPRNLLFMCWLQSLWRLECLPWVNPTILRMFVCLPLSKTILPLRFLGSILQNTHTREYPYLHISPVGSNAWSQLATPISFKVYIYLWFMVLFRFQTFCGDTGS